PGPEPRGAARRPLRQVTSPRNPALSLVRRLQAKRARREMRLLVAEGEDVVLAAVARGVRPAALLVDADRVGPDDPLLDALPDVDERYAVPGPLLARVSALAAAPRVIAVLPQPGPHHFRTVAFPPSLGVFLAGVGDPGNVGTLVRTAAALGCDWVALGPGSADAANPRAVRAAMGATFTIPILEGVTAADLATRPGYRVVAAQARGGVPPWEADLTGPTVLALGGEREGLDPVVADLAAAHDLVAVTIPQAGGAESLNVAAAGAAILAEARRQRASARAGAVT
ncbi:MAG: RNA methyltransferase, partial [Actinomycetota bacterium]